MTQQYKQIPIVVSLDAILDDWAKQYKPTDGFVLIDTQWYIDVHKNKVCFVLGTMKDSK